jgi:hypothetical protein
LKENCSDNFLDLCRSHPGLLKEQENDCLAQDNGGCQEAQDDDSDDDSDNQEAQCQPQEPPTMALHRHAVMKASFRK